MVLKGSISPTSKSLTRGADLSPKLPKREVQLGFGCEKPGVKRFFLVGKNHLAVVVVWCFSLWKKVAKQGKSVCERKWSFVFW